MQLIYLYVKDYRVWKNQGFSLSSDYKVEYRKMNDEDPGLLIIYKKKGLFSVLKENGGYTADIQMIVGKNGAGKSTLLRILMEGAVTERSWFAVYLEEEKAETPEESFVRVLIEGNFFPDPGTNEPCGYQNFELRAYCGKIEKEKICCLQRINSDESREHRPECAYLLFQQSNPVEWFKDQAIYPEFPPESIIRKNVQNTSCQKVLEYIWRIQKNRRQGSNQKNDDLTNFFTFFPEHVTLSISLEEIKTDGFWDELLGKSYEKILEELRENKKEAFITCLFSSLLLFLYKLQLHSTVAYFSVRVMFAQIEREYHQNIRKPSFTINWREYFYKILLRFFDLDELMKKSLENLMESLQSLDDSCYRFASAKEGFLIEKQISECQLESDYIKLNRIVEKIETIHRLFSQRFPEYKEAQKPVKITFRNLSNGEVQLLHLFSSLYYGAEKIYEEIPDAKRQFNCILLLDEPDYGFHPEWSRRLIGYLQNSLKREPFTDFAFTYQLIITTHSPIMLSDIPSENIVCIQPSDEQGGREAGKTEFGFMSNINDLMKNSFFTDSLFGEAARQYTDRCIKELIELRKNVQEWPKDEEVGDDRKKAVADRIKNLERRIRVIEEPMIHGQLLHRLDVLKRSCTEQMMPEEKRKEYWELKSRIRALEEEYEGYPFG